MPPRRRGTRPTPARPGSRAIRGTRTTRVATTRSPSTRVEELAKAQPTSTGRRTTSRTSRTATGTATSRAQRRARPRGRRPRRASTSPAAAASRPVRTVGESRSSTRPPGGYASATGYKVANVTYDPRAETGIIVHEYGHDLGLPDLYDSIGAERPGHGVLGHHEHGSRAGRLNGIQPTHMGAWSKYVLGWLNPRSWTTAAPTASSPWQAPAAHGHGGGRAREPSRQGAASDRPTAATTPGGRTTTRNMATCA